MKVVFRAILIFLPFFCQAPCAVEIDSLYETEVIAKSRMKKDRTAAIKQALMVILRRIVSNSDLSQDKTIKQVIENASYFVREFQYALTGGDKQARLIRIKFDEKRLLDELRPSHLGIWNEIRPRTLVWLVVEENGREKFFEPGLMAKIDAVLEKASILKALPVIYPIQDLEEKRIISINDVLSAYSNHLLDVSLRYDVVSTLAGKMINNGVCWRAEWTLYFDGKIKQWRTACGSLEAAATGGFQGVYATLSNYYAVQSKLKNIQTMTLKIANLKGVKEIATVSRYLDNLPMISTVTRLSSDAGYQLYRIFFHGSRKVLNTTLINGNSLRIEDFSKRNEKQVTFKFIEK